MSLRVWLAGRVAIGTDGLVLDEQRFPGRQGRLMFAYLVSEHGRPVFRDELAEALWGEAPPATWEKALGVLASKLRALLGECGVDGATALTSAFGCYRLELPEHSWVDLLAAAEGVGEAEAALAEGKPEKAKAGASRAASIARLQFLPGEEGAWVEHKRRALADLLVNALGCLSEACLSSGEASEGAKWASEAIALEPFRESGYRRLMRAHVAAGNGAEALRAYERCRSLLAEELGAYPSPETEAIYRELLSAPPSTTRAATAPEDGLASAVVTLPKRALATVPAPLGDGKPAEAKREEPPRRRALPTGRTIAVSATLAGVAVAAALGLLLTRGDRSAPSTSVEANAVGVIDGRSGKVTWQIPVGVTPTAVAATGDAIWVTSADANSVSRVDARTHTVRQTIQVGGGPAGVAVTRNAVWVANGLDGTVSRIDPRTNQVVQTIVVGNGPTGAAFGENAVWVTNSADGTVSRIDADTGQVTRTLPAAIGASGIAVAFHRVWIVSPPSGSVVALDPRSGQVLHRIGVGVDPDAVAAGAGALWAANRADDTVSRIDSRTGAVTNTFRVGRGPEGIAIGPGGIWVANGADGGVSEIDPSTGANLKTVRLDNPPQAIAASPRGVYVAVRSNGAEHRGGTLRVLSDFGPASIDPGLLTSPDDRSVVTMTNDGLIGLRRTGGVQGTELVPNLAVAVPTPTDNARTYTFRLRRGIRYSNGRLVRPDDFRRAIERLFEIGMAGSAAYYGAVVGADRCVLGKPCDLSDGIVADDLGWTVSFHLRAPDADFLTKLALPYAFAVPAGTPARVGSRPIPATGPYRVASYRRRARSLRLVRNRFFHTWSRDAQPQGYPDVIAWSWRFAASAEVRAVERGEADVALRLAPVLPKFQFERLARRSPGQLHVSTDPHTTYFFLNVSVPPFDDVRVRLAVNAAFDRQAFARLLGRGYVPTCQILPPNFPAYRRTCPYAPAGVTGVERARRLVRSSGTAGARVTVWVPTPGAQVGRYMVSVLESIGYRARLKTVQPLPDLRAYYDKVMDSRVRAQTGYFGWSAEFPSAVDFIRPPFSCAGFVPASPTENSNPSHFCDPSIDAQMDRAAAAQARDPAAATLLWQRIERQILAEAPMVPAANQPTVDFVSKRVGNYQYNPQWGLLLDQLWVK